MDVYRVKLTLTFARQYFLELRRTIAAFAVRRKCCAGDLKGRLFSALRVGKFPQLISINLIC